MQPTGTTAPTPDGDPEPVPAPGVPYPHRIRFTEAHKHGIVLGHERDYTALTNWVHTVVPSRIATRVERIAVALASNSHRHTLSGDPGGTVRVVVEVNAFLISVWVSDNGPRNQTVIPYPRLGEPRRPLPGLHLVEELAVFWDWEWQWKGTAMGPLTVRAVVENP